MLLKCTSLTIAFLAVFAAGIGAAPAQDSRYSSDWRAGSSDAGATVLAVSDDTTQQLVDELNALVESGASANAADPRFLQDLRELALRYAWPWRKRLVSEDFSDGDFTQNPEWTVISGSFEIAIGEGLHAGTVAPTATVAKAEPSAEELAVSIIGKLLTGASETRPESKESDPKPAAGPAEIALHTPITNDFAIRLEMSSAGGPGAFELGVAQGEGRLGYRIAYTPGSPMELLRYGSRGVSVIDAGADNVSLEDAERHLVQMTRSDAGEFVVSIDGAEIIRVVDRAFRDPFEAFIVTDQGGGYTVHSLAIFGS